ncbi:hypothetical protein SIN8267_01506 [Sinobacterium norvegicum]|uniref:DUF1214 domain-containing protein n=1 Tax=Sinobacterium norvegicum TaxID=1641715 RepID=A0ABM9AEN6_9GAMM|nr:hypothetical protein [Sinobacterium norvegicum]CAH0991402.1 hypothetical protein SIN8267_01506 [Sinobacterium norvegicum]
MSNEQDILSGKAWGDFCDQLKQAGDVVLRSEAPDNAFDRAEGYRYLTRLARIGLDMFMESGDRSHPSFYRPSHETAKIGADNPDNYYQRAELDGQYDYKISGHRGSVAYLSFGTQSGGYGEDGKNESTGFIDDHDLIIDENGRFELILSVSKPPQGNWLAMTATTRTVIVRQTFLDRSAEDKAELTIARIGADAAPAPLTAAAIATNLQSTAAFVKGTAQLFADWSQRCLPHVNAFAPWEQQWCQDVGGDANIHYYFNYWQLADDEALIIELPSIPDCENWNYQLNNYWMESLDYRYQQIHINKHNAVVANDGSVTIIVSHQTLAVDNLLTTAGHKLGTSCFRWIGAKDFPEPSMRVVKAASLHC